MRLQRVRGFLFVVALGVAGALPGSACSSDGEGSGRGGTSGESGESGAAGDGTGTGGTSGRGGTSSGGAGGDAGSPGTGGSGGDGSVEPNEVVLRVFRGGLQANAEFVAFGDDGGELTEVSGGGGVYRFTPSSDRYTLAVACTRAGGAQNPSFSELFVLHALTSEISALEHVCSAAITPLPNDYTLILSAEGLTAGQEALLEGRHLGSAYEIFMRFTVAASTMALPAPGGTWDFLLGRTTAGRFVDTFIYDPGVTISADLNKTYDFATDGVAPVTGVANVANADAARINVETVVLGPTGHILETSSSMGTAAASYRVLPASELGPDAVQILSAYVFGDDMAVEARTDLYEAEFSGDLTVELADAPDPLISVVDSSPFVRLLAEVPRDADATLYYLQASQSIADAQFFLREYATAGFVGAASTVEIETPDLGTLENFLDIYGLTPDASVNWALEVARSNRSVVETFRGPIDFVTGRTRSGLAGLEVVSTAASGSLQP